MFKKIWPVLILLAACVFWGFSFVAQECADTVGNFALGAVRFAIGAVLLIPVVLIFEKGHYTKAELLGSVYAGLLLFSASTLQQFGITITHNAGVAGFLTDVYAVLVPLALFFVFRQKLSLPTILGAAVGFSGIILLCFNPADFRDFGIGHVLLIGCAVVYTVHILMLNHLTGRGVRPLHLAMGQYAVVAAVDAVAMLIFEKPSVTAMLDAKWEILYIGVFSVAVAYTFQIIGQKHCPATLSAIVLSTESVFSAIAGAIFGEKLSVPAIFGCILVFTGVVLAQLPPFGKKKAEETEPPHDAAR